MKFISWNVNGIRAAWNHGLSAFFADNDADIYAFQETKTNEPVSVIELPGYEAFWSFCEHRSGYSGTLCLTKQHPMNVWYDFGDENFDCEGRIITLEFETFFFVNCYVPNSQSSNFRYDYRLDWDKRLIKHLKHLRYHKPTIVCGDFNVPISDDDIYAQNKWVELNAEGFQSSERENLIELTASGFVDTYRLMHPDETGKYTWWSNRQFKRKENRGWRLDYFFAADSICEHINDSGMLTDIEGSDHCPIFLDINIASAQHEEKQINSRIAKVTYEDLLNMDVSNYEFVLKYADLDALWNSINWKKAEEHLATMQMALAKSAYTNDLGLIEKWQKKIVFSIDAKLLAVRHVCTTAGGPGVDGIKWTTAREKITAALSLTSKGYHALPARLLLIQSKNGKQRRIHIETYYDRAMQALYSYSLDPVAESWGERKSFAYRKGRSAFDLNEHIKTAFSGFDAPEWVFIGDIRKCYENISHEWIMRHIPMAEYVLYQFLKAGYMFEGKLFPMDEGIGIGCRISPIIANMTLDGLRDYIYSRLFPDSEIDYAEGNLIRYADDIIISARSEESARKIQHIVSDFLSERGLELSPDKTKIINVHEGFTFMSRKYSKRNGKLYAEPSEQAIERFKSSVKELVDNHKGSQKTLIEKLNRKIEGWATYHKVSEADTAFRHADVFIKAALLAACEKRHPKWSREKILSKYWFKNANGYYYYALPDKKEVRVKSLSDILLVDYHPVRTNSNPYIDLEYHENRSHDRAMLNATGVYRAIWNRQNGRCHYCGRYILRDEEKTLVEVDPTQSKLITRMAYIHKRCLESSFDFMETEIMPSSLTDVMQLLEQLDEHHKPRAMKYIALSELFRTCEKNSITLTFKQIEEIIDGKLGATALRKEFWYRTGFNTISQCWLENGYQIKTLHLEERRRVVFNLTEKSKNTSSVTIPEVVKYGRVPAEAKYELENYFAYIIDKYGL